MGNGLGVSPAYKLATDVSTHARRALRYACCGLRIGRVRLPADKNTAHLIPSVKGTPMPKKMKNVPSLCQPARVAYFAGGLPERRDHFFGFFAVSGSCSQRKSA